MTESMIEYVQRRLQEHKGEWTRISKDTNVDYSVLARIGQGVNTNPMIENLQPLYDWLQAREKMMDAVRRKEAAA